MNANIELTERDVGFLAHCLLDNDPNIKRILDGEEPETLSRRATGNQRPRPGQASDTPYSKKLHKIRKEGFLNEY